MKNKVLLIATFFILFAGIKSQTVVNVEPGIGTLNDAITTNGEATYVLQADKWYGLNAIIQTTTPITIIGETPAEGQMPAIIQNGATSTGETFPFMFIITSDLTLKNVFVVNADLNEGLGSGTIYQAASGKVIVDSVTVDPIGGNFFLLVNAEDVATYVTNSLLMRHGNTLSINDGGVFWNQGTQWDTLYVENNTFVDVGTAWLLSAATANGARAEFHWINHNSFLFGKAHLNMIAYADEMFFTNNLLWMFDTYLFKTGGEETWDPGNGNIYQGFFDADTIVVDTTDLGLPIYETLPCDRKSYVHYNTNYRTQAIWDMIVEDKQNGVDSYLKAFLFPKEYSDSCRATRIYNDNTSFPYFTAGNNLEDFDGEITANDPNFLEQKIYDLTDSAEAWAEVDWRFIRGEQGLPESSEWPNYFYSIDGNNSNPTSWPRFNGEYTNSTLLNASIENLPLGDLNWFPNSKKLWAENQQTVMDHILALDTNKINLTSVRNTDDLVPNVYQLSQNYPNPFNPSTTIKYSIPEQGIVTLKIFNVLGQEVAILINKVQSPGNYAVDFNAANLASGMYIYQLQAGDVNLTKKLMLLK